MKSVFKYNPICIFAFRQNYLNSTVLNNIITKTLCVCMHVFVCVCVWRFKNNIFPVTQDTAQVLKFSQLGKNPVET